MVQKLKNMMKIQIPLKRCFAKPGKSSERVLGVKNKFGWGGPPTELRGWGGGVLYGGQISSKKMESILLVMRTKKAFWGLSVKNVVPEITNIYI